MRTPRILLVDDEPDIRRVAEIALARLGGFAVELATSGEDGIARATERPPDLILLDVSMPDLDGPGTLARLRGSPRTASIPVAFLTARCQPSEVRHLLSLGAAAVLEKPFDPVDLPRRVREVLSAGTPPEAA